MTGSSKRLAVFAGAIFLFASFLPATAQTHRTENIVIVTLDGMRRQEIFGGIDSALVANPKYTRDKDNLEEKFGASSPAIRRSRLMPFLWTTLVREGQIYGDRELGSLANTANPFHISYPGYNEILTGYVDSGINSNDKKLNPNTTVLEFLNRQKSIEGKVAAFCTWDRFPFILNKTRCGFPINADTDRLALNSPVANLYNNLSDLTPRPLGCRPDLITYLYAREWLVEKRPRVLLISFLETDYAAHNGLYDTYITSAHAEDAMIADCWRLLQSMDGYRNKTTLIVTCDHGRGDRNKDQWTFHGHLEDSGDTWIAVIGPDSPSLGEVATTGQIYQKQLAPTIAKLLGFQFVPKGGPVPPIDTIIK
jgi:hypothetical protein